MVHLEEMVQTVYFGGNSNSSNVNRRPHMRCEDELPLPALWRGGGGGRLTYVDTFGGVLLHELVFGVSRKPVCLQSLGGWGSGYCCRANMARIRQSQPDSGLGCQKKHHSNPVGLFPVRSEVVRFRSGLVSKAHRLWYHSTLGLRVIKKKKKRR